MRAFISFIALFLVMLIVASMLTSLLGLPPTAAFVAAGFGAVWVTRREQRQEV